MGEQIEIELLSSLRSSKWPYNNKYFVAELMEAEGALTLLICDAEFLPPDSILLDSLTTLDILKTGTNSYSLKSSENHFDAKLSMSDLDQGDTRVIFVPQKRRYFRNSTVNGYGIQSSTWFNVLSSCEILPDAIEVLHENNGGWGVHTSYCADVKGESCTPSISDTTQDVRTCAYHIWLKPRPWWNEEHFLYARCDLHTGQNFFLVAGTSLDQQVQRLSSRFSSTATQPNIFSILLALITTWTKDLEHFVWDQDFATQKLESDTGWSTIGHTQLKPLPPEKLAVRRDLVTTKDTLSHAARASESFSELFFFLSKKVHLSPAVSTFPAYRPDQLEDAFLQYGTRQFHQKQQANALILRIDAQWNAVNALVAQHNNGLNYQIASDSRTDTIVMRRISFVTIAFLPATFLATFFSMTFFDIDLGRITMSPMIWVYFVCVIPVTLVIAWQSSTLALSNPWKKKEESPTRRTSGVTRKRQARGQLEMQRMA